MAFLWRLIDPVAALRQVSYLLWVIFAAVLNASVWWMKKQKRTNVHFLVAIQFSMCYTCITSSERPIDRE
ncbi:MAG: TspO/MBR family protein [Clostridium sp.]